MHPAPLDPATGLTLTQRADLLRAVGEHGWRDGAAAFLLSMPAEDAIVVYRRLFLDGGGWRFLVGHRRLRRVLCVDRLPAAVTLALAPRCVELHVAHPDPHEVRAVQRRLEAKGVTHAAGSVLDPGEVRLPFPDGFFDAIVVCDPAVADGTAPGVGGGRWFAEMHRVLAAEGLASFRLDNRYGFPRLLGRTPRTASDPATSLRRVRRALASAGFAPPVVHDVLTDGGTVREVLFEATSPFLGGGGPKRVLKRLLLRRPLRRWLAPGFVVTCSKGPPVPSFVSDLIHELRVSGAIGTGDSRLEIRWYRVLFGKVILSVGDPRARFGRMIVILPLSRPVDERRRHESAVLDELAGLPEPVASQVPRSVASGELHGNPYHVITEIPGTAIDSAVPLLDRATSKAAEWITAFHERTVRSGPMTPDTFERVAGAPLRRIEEVFGAPVGRPVARIRMHLEDRLLGTGLPCVWLHGDFKIENVLFDPDRSRIRGIIDWDLSEREGLPFLDPLYLVAYNRHLREKRRLEDIFFDVVLPGNFEPDEAALLSRYAERIGIDEAWIESLRILFWIHHLSRRLYIDPVAARILERLRSTPGKIDAYLHDATERAHEV